MTKLYIPTNITRKFKCDTMRDKNVEILKLWRSLRKQMDPYVLRNL